MRHATVSDNALGVSAPSWPQAGASPDYCGDGVVNGPEECDLGADNQPDPCGPGLCSTACLIAPYCGDGMVRSSGHGSSLMNSKKASSLSGVGSGWVAGSTASMPKASLASCRLAADSGANSTTV